MVKNRKPLILITVLVAAVLLMAGTFAWQQMISKVNEFIGSKNGEVLHDDFNPATGAKDVYVENPNSGELFIRVKLNEAMNLASNTWRPIPNSTDWITHTCLTGDPADCGHFNVDGDLFHDYFTWTMGGQKYYMPADGSEQVVQDKTVYTGSEYGTKLTPYAQIITAADYLAMGDGRAAFVGWIYDADGYAYWSQPLGKGEVTGLLLHHVSTDLSLKDTDYYYAIDVIVEAVDEADIPMWTEGAESVDGSHVTYPTATDNGKSVISSIVSLATSAEETMP